MQDGGLPHIGCVCTRCEAAAKKPGLARYAACLAIIDRRNTKTAVWIIDATPDIKWQLNMLAAELGPHPERTVVCASRTVCLSLMRIWDI